MSTSRLRLPSASRLAYAGIAAVLGAFIADRLQPTWHALVNHEYYRQQGEIYRKDGVQWVVLSLKSPPQTRTSSGPWWALGGAAVGAVLGYVGRDWQLRGRLVSALVCGLFGSALGALVAITSPAFSRYRGDPYFLILQGAILGGVLGLVAGLYFGGPVRRREPAPAAVPGPT